MFHKLNQLKVYTPMVLELNSVERNDDDQIYSYIYHNSFASCKNS